MLIFIMFKNLASTVTPSLQHTVDIREYVDIYGWSLNDNGEEVLVK